MLSRRNAWGGKAAIESAVIVSNLNLGIGFNKISAALVRIARTTPASPILASTAAYPWRLSAFVPKFDSGPVYLSIMRGYENPLLAKIRELGQKGYRFPKPQFAMLSV